MSFRAQRDHFGHSSGGMIALLICFSDRPPSKRFRKLHRKWGESNESMNELSSDDVRVGS
jgi:hypothetical protein